MTDVITKQDVRKLLPRKSSRVTPSSLILNEPPKPVEEGDALGQAKTAIEWEIEEKSTKKPKDQKQVKADQVVETKSKGIVEGSKLKGLEKVKKSDTKEKEKHGENQVRKRKT